MKALKFHNYGTSFKRLAVDEYAVTNAKGVAKFENVLISGSTPYTLEGSGHGNLLCRTCIPDRPD